MTNPVAVFNPEDSLRSGDLSTKTVMLKANTVAIPAFTPLKREAVTFKCIPATTIGDKIVGITVPLPDSGWQGLVGIAISTVDQMVEVYTECDVAEVAVNYSFIAAAVDRNTKDAVFDSTEITVHFDALGF